MGIHINFYHLTCVNLQKSLPKLLEKIFQQGHRCLVVAKTEAEVSLLNDQLWTYHPESFLPHGTHKDGEASDYPIWISTSQENANNATVLLLTSPLPLENPDSFQKAAYLFEGTHDKDLTAARSLWRQYKSEHTLTYWQQDTKGQWEQKAQEGRP